MKKFLPQIIFIISLIFCQNSWTKESKNSGFSIDGSLNNTAGYAQDKTTGNQNYQNDDVNFVNNSEIHFKFNETANDLKYGAQIDLEAAFADYKGSEAFNIDKSYIFAEAKFGRVEIGNNIGVNQKMKVGAANLARGAGGINGKYLEFIDLPILANSNQGFNQIGNCQGFNISGSSATAIGSDCANIKLPRFILIPQSPISHGGYAQSFYHKSDDNNYTEDDQIGFYQSSDGNFGSLESATKINYYTPRISGLQIGASFTPDTGNSGGTDYFSGNPSNDIKDVINWGVNYSDNFENISFAASITGETGKAEQNNFSDIQRNNLNSYDIGMMASYFGFTIGASYGNWGESLMPKNGIYSCKYNANVDISEQSCNLVSDKAFSDADYYSAGLAYKFGPVALSLTHLKSEFQNNKYAATSLGLDYKVSKGVMPYFEVTGFDFESDDVKASDVLSQTEDKKQIRDNKGYVALVGVQLSF